MCVAGWVLCKLSFFDDTLPPMRCQKRTKLASWRVSVIFKSRVTSARRSPENGRSIRVDLDRVRNEFKFAS